MFKLKYVGDKSLLKENDNPCHFCIFKDDITSKACQENCRNYDGFCYVRFKDKD